MANHDELTFDLCEVRGACRDKSLFFRTEIAAFRLPITAWKVSANLETILMISWIDRYLQRKHFVSYLCINPWLPVVTSALLLGSLYVREAIARYRGVKKLMEVVTREQEPVVSQEADEGPIKVNSSFGNI